MSVFSNLGQFLKDVDSLSLASNRWAPLLPAEKAALSEVAGPIGIVEGNWDFGFHYEWQEALVLEEHLTAEREVSYRHWSAGVQVQGVKIQLPFAIPHRGGFAAEVGLGRDGDFVLGSTGDIQMEWNPNTQSDTKSGWGGKYQGCYHNSNRARPDLEGELDWYPRPKNTNVGRVNTDWGSGGTAPAAMNAAWISAPSVDLCDTLCAGYTYFGLIYTNCICGNSYGVSGVAAGCGDQGSSCDPGGQTCFGIMAIWQTTVWSLEASVATAVQQSGSACWSALPSFVPEPHTLRADTGGGTVSSQGAAYFAGEPTVTASDPRILHDLFGGFRFHISRCLQSASVPDGRSTSLPVPAGPSPTARRPATPCSTEATTCTTSVRASHVHTTLMLEP